MAHLGNGGAATSMFRKTKLCRFYLIGRCLRGGACQFAHGRDELQPLPDFYCTKMCPELLSTGRCQKGAACTYAHNREELLPCVEQSDDARGHAGGRGRSGYDQKGQALEWSRRNFAASAEYPEDPWQYLPMGATRSAPEAPYIEEMSARASDDGAGSTGCGRHEAASCRAGEGDGEPGLARRSSWSRQSTEDPDGAQDLRSTWGTSWEAKTDIVPELDDDDDLREVESMDVGRVQEHPKQHIKGEVVEAFPEAASPCGGVEEPRLRRRGEESAEEGTVRVPRVDRHQWASTPAARVSSSGQQTRTSPLVALGGLKLCVRNTFLEFEDNYRPRELRRTQSANNIL